MEKRISTGIKKVVITGPESTGKTQLTEELAAYFNTVYIPEYARTYVEQLKDTYKYTDIEKIAYKQIEFESQLLPQANQILFYDTFLIITKVWFDMCYKKYPDWFEKALKNMHIDLFLVCQTDIPWEPDAVRENGGEMREKLRDLYIYEIVNYGFKYEIVEGMGEERLNAALEKIYKHLE